MALNAAAIYRSRERDRLSIPVTAGTVIYHGALVSLDVSEGTAINFDDSATTVDNRFLGVAYVTDQRDAALAAGESVTGLTDGSVEVSVDTSGLVLESVTVTGVGAQSDVGALVYATDENILTLTQSAGQSPIGFVSRWILSTTCDVQLFSATEVRAFAGA